MPDRSILGGPSTTQFLAPALISFVLPADSSLLWATVDFNPTVPLRSPRRGMVDRLRLRRPSRIGLIWRTGPASSSMAGSRWPVASSAPAAGRRRRRWFLLYTPPGIDGETGEVGGLDPAGSARLEMARADWLARGVGDLVAKFDRSSGRDHEKLVSLAHQSRDGPSKCPEKRSMDRVGRAPRQSVTGPITTSRSIRSARTARDETIAKAGLEDDLSSARIYLGETLADVSRSPVGVPEPSAPDRIRCWVGR